jgi:transglutaminase-like putative cysteine protease
VVVLTLGFTRLIATQWTEGLTITRTLAYLGVAAGLALGYSRFSGRTAAIFAIVYGLFAVPWRLGLLMGEGILWQERISSLIGRLSVTINQIVHQQAVTDNLLFLTLMSALFWTLGVHAGYSLTRHANPWRTILPTGLAMVVIHSYDSYISSRSWYLVLYLFFALLLVTRLVYLQRRQRWEQNNTYIPPQLGVDFIRVALAATVILLLLSWTAPALADSLPAAESAWQQVKRPWDRVRDRFDNAFASLRSSVGIINDYYGTSLSLGRGNRLSDQVIFDVLTPVNPPEGVRFYWRARVFDVYENGGWTSTLTDYRPVSPEDFNLRLPPDPSRFPGLYTFSFTPQSPIATLIVAPQPLWVSRPARAEVAVNPDGTVDVGSIRANPAIQAGEVYHVRSSLSNVTIAQLRQSGSQYPEWVTQRYLELPEEITPRTRQLAQEITAGADNPYDKAQLITQYLRTNILYSETVPELPDNQELIDWFLFDLRQGFCNYYASAEVILLRSVGIPARIALGYAQGEFQETTTEYIVRQRDAHAWPEVYFSGLGWVEFEPTAGQPELARPLGEELNTSNPNAPTIDELQDRLNNLPDRGENQNQAAGAGLSQQETTIWRIALIAGLALVLVLILVPFRWKRRLLERIPPFPILVEKGIRKAGFQPPPTLMRWAQRASLSPLSRAYQEINHGLNRLGRKPVPAYTPAERVSALSQELPAVGEPAHRLLGVYQNSTYGQLPPDIEAARKAGTEIRTLTLKAFLQRLIRGRPDKDEHWYQKYRQ